MENCEYTKTFQDVGVEIKEYEKNNWKPMMRQCLITSGVCCLYFLQGLFLGAPTVFIAQIRRDVNSTEIITDEMLSWLTSTPVISAVPFVVILPLLFNRIGRKYTFIFIWSLETIGFIILYSSTNLHHILIAEICAGPTFASTITISPVILAEYTSPKYRGIFLSLKGASAVWGIWVSNAIGTFFYWKNISIAAFVCSIHLLSVLVWPESPYWLAKRGRYIECAEAYRWLRGISEKSEKELAQLIVSQKNFNEAHLLLSKNTNGFCNLRRLSRMWSITTSRSFYKPVVISVILIAQFYLSGKFVISLYAIEVLKHLSPDESFVYKEMLILDAITVIGMYIGCVVSRYYKRRILLLLFSVTGCLVLYILSIYIYLASLSVIIANDIVILSLLTIFSLTISCGPLMMCTSIYGEITPRRYQNPAMMIVGAGGVTTMSLLLKLSPFMFKHFKMHGSFLFYAVSSSILLIILYVHLPETKNKTIQEIEQYFNKNRILADQDKTPTYKDIELNNLMQ